LSCDADLPDELTEGESRVEHFIGLFPEEVEYQSDHRGMSPSFKPVLE
jgi:hypothetical protein